MQLKITMSCHKTQRLFSFQVIHFVCLVLVAIASPHLIAAPINLSQQPAGRGGKEPAPNVILSVDDSGSMGWDSPSRMSSLKAALIAQFGDGATNFGAVEDNRIRLAWQSMWGDTLSVGAGTTNSMKRFSGQHRVNFKAFVDRLSPNGGTPSHKMLAQAYSYMKSPAGLHSPWALNPGVTESPYLSCRRTYHIFMTDGEWNSEYATSQSVGNFDGISHALPQPHLSLALPPSPFYDPTSDQVKIYKDAFGRTKGTLSDFAFRNWAEDLQPVIANEIKPLIRQIGNEVIGGMTLQEFWNPKNNPATWQHITQYTIGFGAGASSWYGAPAWDNATDNTYGGDYARLVNGTVGWPDPMPDGNQRTPELWHAAINGRGKFYPARSAAALSAAFRDILDNIFSDTSQSLASIAANSSSLKSGAMAYVAGYVGVNWSGKLSAYPINATTGALDTTALWNAAAKLDAADFSVANRFVASYNGLTGIEWATYTNLPEAQKIPLNRNSLGTVDNNGQLRLNYLRGDRTQESSQTGGLFRVRGSRLGDIVNSNIVYVGAPASDYGDTDYRTFKGTSSGGVGGRSPMVYVGANDGMLHGFDAANGAEKLAFIPQGIAQMDLRKLTDQNYAHQYFVDGSPFTSDAKVGNATGGSAWRTVLVSGLAGGGKGYVVLDASNPNNFNAYNVANLVIADTTASTDVDMGHMYITPAMSDLIVGKSDQIVRLNAPTTGTAPNQIKHRWALVLGNGYNSSNEAPVLLVQYLDGAKEIKKISPCISMSTGTFDTTCAFKTANGLSTPRLLDLNADGIVDVAYAGDLNGNVWKFDLSSINNANWKTSFSNVPFFKAKPGQSFTTAPYVVSNDSAGYGVMVNINSGRNLTTADQSSTGTDTVYTLWDDSTFKNIAFTPATSPATYYLQITDTTPINTSSSVTLPSTLVEQTISATTFVDKGDTSYFTSSTNPVSYTGASPKRGWYMDWAVPGQRVLQNSKAFDGQKIQISSIKPNSAAGSTTDETCTPAVTNERNFLTILNLFNGNPSKSLVYDLTPTAAASHPNTTTIEGKSAGNAIGLRTGTGIKMVPPCEGKACTAPLELKFGKYVGTRANWHEKR